jgi:glutaredoxin
MRTRPASAPAERADGVATATITVYSKPDCHLCEEAMTVLGRLREELGFALRELDITADDDLHRAYFERIPVVVLDGEELCEYHVSEALVRERLESRR